MSNQEAKLLALKILQWLSSGFSKLFEYLLLGFVTVFLIYVAKVSNVNLSWASEFITTLIQLLFMVFIGALLIDFFNPSKYLSNLYRSSARSMIKLGYILWLVNDFGDLSANAINNKSSGLITALAIALLAKWLFNFVCNYYGNVLVDECIDLDYTKLKDYKVTDSFIADDYKNIQVDSQSLSITKNGSDTITTATGHVTFKVLKLPVKLDFIISPYMSGTLVSNETQIRFETGERPLGIAKQIKKTIKI